jgi:AcrR family transcriptional regulator
VSDTGPRGGKLRAVPAADELDPRIERSRELVLAAAVDLLREVGYGSLTIEAVAARSGVAKSTIYRQWSGKAQMVADAFVRAHGYDSPLLPPPGPVRDRVVAVLRAMIADMGSTDRLACLMPALIDAAERSDEIAEMTRRIAEEKNARLRMVLDEGVERGELPPGLDTTALADALVGPILVRRLFHRPALSVGDVPALVDQILPALGPVPERVSP